MVQGALKSKYYTVSESYFADQLNSAYSSYLSLIFTDVLNKCLLYDQFIK